MRTHHSLFELDGSGPGRRTMGPLLSTCLSFGRSSNHSVPTKRARVFLGVRPASSVYKVARRSGPVALIVNRSKQSGYVVLHTLITLAKHKHSYPVQVQHNIIECYIILLFNNI